MDPVPSMDIQPGPERTQQQAQHCSATGKTVPSVTQNWVLQKCFDVQWSNKRQTMLVGRSILQDHAH